MHKTLPMTGERYIPGMIGDIELEHLHRYTLTRDLAKNKRVLDLACGEGYGSHLLASVAELVIGVDISPDTIEYASQKYSLPNLKFLVGSCDKIPLNDKSVDIVASFETIEHHNQHKEMISEIYRVLKDDGLLIISSPNKEVYSDIPKVSNKFHIKELYFDEFRSLLEQYFPNVEIYGQRVLKSSIVAALSPRPMYFQHFQSKENQTITTDTMNSAVYFIALASKHPPPPLKTSIYESEENDIPMHETKIYWRSSHSDNNYSEQDACTLFYPVNEQAQKIKFTFPQKVNGITHLRLDISNAIGIIDIDLIKLIDHEMNELWTWSGHLNNFINGAQVFIYPNPNNKNGLTVISLGNDPRFEINIPLEILSKIKARGSLLLHIKPYNPIDKLPSIIENLTKSLKNFSRNHFTSSYNGKIKISSKLDNGLSEISKLILEQQGSNKSKNHQLNEARKEIIRLEIQLEQLKKQVTL